MHRCNIAPRLYPGFFFLSEKTYFCCPALQCDPSHVWVNIGLDKYFSNWQRWLYLTIKIIIPDSALRCFFNALYSPKIFNEKFCRVLHFLFFFQHNVCINKIPRIVGLWKRSGSNPRKYFIWRGDKMWNVLQD